MMTATDETTEDFVLVKDPYRVQGEEALSIKITPGHDTIGLEVPSTATEFCATATARSLPKDDDSVRAPVDVVVALDVSDESMRGEKLELCKQTLSLLLRELSSEDRFGLVTFGREATVAIPTSKLTESNRKTAIDKITGIHASRTTNTKHVDGGVGAAIDELRSVDSPDEVRAILLLTDGRANVGGVRGVADVVQERLVERVEGAPTTSARWFVFGADHDRETSRDVAGATTTRGGGTCCFVVLSAVGDALVATRNVVAELRTSSLGVHDAARRNDRAADRGSRRAELDDFCAEEEESRDVVLLEAASSSRSTTTRSCSDTIHEKLVVDRVRAGGVLEPEGGREISADDSRAASWCVRVEATKVVAETERLEETGSAIRTSLDDAREGGVAAASSSPSSDPLASRPSTESNSVLSGVASRTERGTRASKHAQTTRSRTDGGQRCSELTPSSFDSVKGGGEVVSAPANVHRSRSRKVSKTASSVSRGGISALAAAAVARKERSSENETAPNSSVAERRKTVVTRRRKKIQFTSGGIAAEAAASFLTNRA